ncbi:MAG: sugar phosphate isomerase/epimerase [Armatimonadetes bacterium]|nr:sugar phosphate isomerase/epimerase [Armatimonadota bacterium]
MQKFAICNETYQDWTWEEVCRSVAETGYNGVEIAPFTFGPDVRDVGPARRREIRQAAADHGLEIVGLHWLLVSPKGLHVHTRDAELRAKTVAYLRALIEFAGDVGAPVMIFGSPFQRKLEDGDRQGAWERTQDSYRQLLPDLEARGVRLCQESLPAPECDFIMTAAEAARMVGEIAHPNFRLMLDVKSMCSEDRSPAEIIREFAPLVDHFHANDANRRGPGFGDTDFRPIACALQETGYQGYVSVEVFDYTPDAVTIARESLRTLREVFGL